MPWHKTSKKHNLVNSSPYREAKKLIPNQYNTRPKASVILPVFNAEAYLEEAVRSVRDQTFTDFECLLLNDGSTDGSLAILEKFATQDSRFKIHSWPNRGLIKTLNRGIELSKGDIIFRMDADDVCEPQRFERQFAYMETHPECVALGSRILLIDEAGLPICHFSPQLTHEEIDASHLAGKGGAICHPAAAIRRSALKKIGNYLEEYPHAEDLDLFLRLGEVGKLANLAEILLHYRQHTASVCYVHSDEQGAMARNAAQSARSRRGIEGLHSEKKKDETISMSALHRKWAWWALGAGNLKTARKHAWRAIAAHPFDPANLRLAACVLRGY